MGILHIATVVGLLLVSFILLAFGGYVSWRAVSREERRPVLYAFVGAELIFLGFLMIGSTAYLDQPRIETVILITLVSFFTASVFFVGTLWTRKIYKSVWLVSKTRELRQRETQKRKGGKDDSN